VFHPWVNLLSFHNPPQSLRVAAAAGQFPKKLEGVNVILYALLQ